MLALNSCSFFRLFYWLTQVLVYKKNEKMKIDSMLFLLGFSFFVWIMDHRSINQSINKIMILVRFYHHQWINQKNIISNSGCGDEKFVRFVSYFLIVLILKFKSRICYFENETYTQTIIIIIIIIIVDQERGKMILMI